ncbi:MAG: hypothetical protein EB078_05965 [Proteobacteria bacterium]|nr:hypothetical protein [Pseudomonadota bacterium]NDC24414.1 hypothetical protein [Pseudomonadota bacterium]NDD04430.1 hypothetical protein [Pseudomonadota bacterium]NDG26896.1 hypothetical protein [Pseudomonadota bacterium]
MSKPPKIDRKILRTPDEFVQKGTQFLGKLSSSRMGLTPLLIAVGVVVVAFYAYDQWDNSKEQKAWTEYYGATKVKEEEKWQKLEKVHQQWPSSRAGMLSAVELGDHYFDSSKKEVGKDLAKVSKDSDSAVEWYSKALQSKHLVPLEKQLLLINRANAWELQSKWEQSLADYQLAENTSAQAKGLALLGEARIYEAKGSTDKAIEVYQKTATEFASTEYGKLAKNHIRRLKSPLFSVKKS